MTNPAPGSNQLPEPDASMPFSAPDSVRRVFECKKHPAPDSKRVTVEELIRLIEDIWAERNWMLAGELRDKYRLKLNTLIAERDQAVKDNRLLREMLWWRFCNHDGKYGDDGERQCNHQDCRIDFMRDSVESIHAKFEEAGTQLALKYYAWERDKERVESERDTALAEVERLKEQVRRLENERGGG